MPSSIVQSVEFKAGIFRRRVDTQSRRVRYPQLAKAKNTVKSCYECGDIYATHIPPVRRQIDQALRKSTNRTVHNSIQLPTRLNAVPNEEAVSSPDAEEEALQKFLDSLKFDDNDLLVAIAQHADTGAILMQAFANRAAVEDTLRRGKATFYSRSRQALWTKGETSNNFIQVMSVHVDCDRDSLIYLGVPLGPSCHTGADTCFYTRVDGPGGAASLPPAEPVPAQPEAALATLFMLEDIIRDRAQAPVVEGSKPSWTKKLLDDPEKLCGKVREEADELARTWEDNEGKKAAASEMADVLYHSMVLLNKQDVPLSDVCEVLRGRFGISGIDEKASRPKK